VPAGKPTKYNADTVSKCKQYLKDYETPIPSVAGLAIYLGVSRSSIYEWAKVEGREEYSDILEQILATQEQVLFSKGLTNDFNATIVKLALGKHGYHDKADTTLSGPSGGPVQTDSIFEFIPVGSNDSSKED
jgi:hypothetical protein